MSAPLVGIVKNPVIPDEQRIREMVFEVIRLAGGLDSVVRPGDSVIIKGNFFAPYPPPVSVDRRVVKALIEALYASGAGSVVLCEAVSIGTKMGRGSSTRYVLDELGVTEVVESLGAKTLCLEDCERILLPVPHAKSIDTISYPKDLYECDVLIDLPCLKTHGMCLVTLGIKNFQGLFDDQQRYYAHRDDLEQKLVDIFKIRKPDFTLIDGLTAMEGNGSGESGTPKIMNILLAGKDVVATDAVACACMGIDPFDVSAVRIADYDGIGCGRLEEIQIAGESVESVRQVFRYPDKFAVPLDRRLLARYPNVDVRIGGACRQCWGLAGNVAKKLSRYPDKKFTLIIGVDPKIACADQIDPAYTIVFGDCACAAAGPVKELRNKMLLEQKGCIAHGCPPYRPASAIIEDYLQKLGLLRPEEAAEKNAASIRQFYDYYKAIDPTWRPLSER